MDFYLVDDQKKTESMLNARKWNQIIEPQRLGILAATILIATLLLVLPAGQC